LIIPEQNDIIKLISGLIV